MKTIVTFSFSLGFAVIGWLAPVGTFGAANAGEIPDWAEVAVQTTCQRYLAWKGNDTAVAVPFVTDVHSFKAEIDEADGFADSKRHIRILRRASEVFGADATADLGDIGLDCMGVYTEPSSAEHQATRIASQQALYADFTRPHLAVVGNHDHGAATNKITNAQFGDFFNNPGFARSKDLVTGPNRDYGYYDVPGKNARLFFLNTTDTVAGNGYGISDDQVEFLRTHLAELKDGATAVIFSHYCLHQRLGRWDEPGWKPYNVKNIDTTIKVIEDFAARTDVHLAGVIAGDSHYDNHVVTNGVRWLISQGFGGCSADYLHSDPGHAVTTGFSRGKQTLIDVAAFKPATGEFRMFRIGAGGADRDVDFNDVFTWTGAAGDCRWSTAGNWETTSTTHAVPQSGDNVVAKVADNCTVTNDIPGLELPYLKLIVTKTVNTGTVYSYFRGEAITLTGGGRALSVGEEGVSGGSHRLYNYIPFHLPAGTNYFFCTPGRLHQYGKLSGPGAVRVAAGANYYSPSADNDYTGGTFFDGGRIDFSGNARCCMGDVSKEISVDGDTYFRLYSGTEIPYSFRLSNQDSRSVSGYTFYMEGKHAFTGAFRGDGLTVMFPSAQTLTLDGPVTLSGALRLPSMCEGSKVPQAILNGRLSVGNLNRDVDTSGVYAGKNLDIFLNAADNAIGAIYASAENYYAGAVNAFGTNAVIRPGVLDDERGLFDLCGFDQTIDRIVLNDKYPIDAQHPVGHIVTSSKGPAALTLSATEDCETDALFSGDLSLVWNPQGDFAFQTYAAFGREMSMSGKIVVSNGTFTVNGANSFPLVSAIEVADGATFVWDSSVAGGLGKVTSVKLGRGATLRVTATAAWPFEMDADIAEACLDISSEAVLDFRSGDTFVVRRFAVDGVRKNPMTTYGHADAAQIPEGAQVQVTVEMAKEADPRTWTGGASGTDVSLADNWSGTGAPSLYDGSLEPTFASGGSLASVFGSVYMRNISFTGDNDFTLKGENDGAKLFLEGGIAAADRGTDATYALQLPVVLRSDQAWKVNGEKTKLVVGNGISGEGDVTLSGAGQLELNVKDCCAWPGSLTSAAGDITLKGELTSAEGKITYDNTLSKLTLSGARIAKTIVVMTGGGTAFTATAGDNAIGGLDLSGNTTISVAEGSKLTISGDVRLRAYCYPEGKGVFIFTNVNLLASAACQPTANSTIYIDYPGLPITSYFDVRGRLYTRCPNALGLSQPQFYDGGVWDLCGYNQTCGRFSWISTYNADGSFATLKTTQVIRSDAPATLTVHHDNKSGSGSNKGPQVYAGKIVGQVSLVKTGYNYDTVQDLTIASEIASTGSVEVSWGLLSFTNAFVCEVGEAGKAKKSYSLPGGRWPNCTRATAGRQVAKGGDVHYGTLELLHSKALGKKAEVYVAKGGAKVRLGDDVRQRVSALYFEDDAGNWVKQPVGSWGSSTSRAEHNDNDRFEGPGLLLVGDMGMPIIVR